jgi:outer membrane protein assembly factor BamB
MMASAQSHSRSRLCQRRFISAASVIACLGFGALSSAQNAPLDYPQWRGRDRDGAASGFVEPKPWPRALTRGWSVEVGAGYGTPLVLGTTVYVFTRRDDEEVMTALDASTGKALWRTGYSAPYVPSGPTVAHGAGPKATPTYHDGKLFTLGVSGIVAAFDASSGRILWRTPAPAEVPFFSAASSPVAAGRLVIAHPGNYGPLTAFDVNTGVVQWTAGDGGAFASPILATIAGVRQVISATQRAVIGVSLDDGGVLWEFPWPGASGGPTPTLHGDTVIVSGPDLGVAALRPMNSANGWAVDRLWETKDVSMYLSNPVVIGDAVFGLSQRASGQFFALDAKTGVTLWLGTPREATNTAVVKAGDLLFLLNDDAELIVARSNRVRFEPIQRYPVGDSATWAQPAISGQRVFVKGVTSLTLWTLNSA